MQQNKQKLFVGSVIEWLERCDCDRLGIGSKPFRAIWLCPWERHFTALSPAWWSWQVVLNFSHISIKLKKQNKKFRSDSINIMASSKQIGVIAYPMY